MKPSNHRSATSGRALLASWLTAAAACIGALLVAASPLQAAQADALATAYEAAWQQFQRAAGGDAKAIEPAADQFGRLAAAEPGDPVLLAYSGAATAMRANTTWLPWRKMSFADEGLAQIDKALTLLNAGHDTLLHKDTPASLETRFVAASTFLALPAMFNRHARGARLLDEVLKHPLLAAAPLAFRAAVWMRAGTEAAKDKRNDDARRWLQQVVSSGAPQAAGAQAKLKELSQ